MNSKSWITGNCFFHAVLEHLHARGLYLNLTDMDLRRIVVDYIQYRMKSDVSRAAFEPAKFISCKDYAENHGLRVDPKTLWLDYLNDMRQSGMHRVLTLEVVAIPRTH